MSIRQKKKRAMKLLQRALLLLQQRANQQPQKMMRVNLQKVQLPKMKNLLKLQREKTGKPLHRILKLNKQKQKQLRVNLQKQQRVSLKHQNKLRLELRLQKEKLSLLLMVLRRKQKEWRTEERRWSYQRAQSRETTPISGIHFNINDLQIISGWPQ